MYGLLDGRLHVVGGRNFNLGFTLVTHEAYNPTTDTWTTYAALPTGRSGADPATLNAPMHVKGAEGNATPNGTFEQHESYNPATNSWTTLAPMLTPRHGLAAGTIGNKIYTASGGPRGGAFFSNTLEMFEFTTACGPRPRVVLQTSRVGPGRLQGQITATTNAGLPPNRLVRIDVTRIDNASVDIRSSVGQQQPFSLNLPDRPASIVAVVRRLAAGAFTARFTVHDDCGSWPTFIGGGPGVP
jgi:hypothetical protein